MCPVCQRVQNFTALLQYCHCSFCNADILDENNMMAALATLRSGFAPFPIAECWQTLGGTQLPLCYGCVRGILCCSMSKVLVGRWEATPCCEMRSSPAGCSEHICVCSYLPDLGRVSRESSSHSTFALHYVVKGRRAFRSTVLKPTAIIFQSHNRGKRSSCSLFLPPPSPPLTPPPKKKKAKTIQAVVGPPLAALIAEQ